MRSWRGGWGKNHIKTLDKLGHLGTIDSNNKILNSYSSMKIANYITLLLNLLTLVMMGILLLHQLEHIIKLLKI